MWHSVRYLGSEIQSTANQVWQEIRKTDRIRGIDRFYTMNGLDKISQVLIPFFKLLQAFSVERVNVCLAIVRGQRDLYQGTLIIPWSLKLIKKPSISNILVFSASIFKTAHVLIKYDLCNFETYQRWATHVGEYPVFKHTFAGYWLTSPRDFFLFLSGTCEVVRISSHYTIRAVLVRNPVTSNALLEPKMQIKKRKDLLRLTSELGKMTLALFRGSTRYWNDYAKLGFYALEMGIYSVSLIRIFIR